MFQTVRQVARYLGVPEHLVRSLVAQGECPGIYSGNRFLVHTEGLREYLDAASHRNKEAGAQ
jgi:excisionase family DNA binding protein|nr:MAG TPA: helix-turn-helix domain protein [Caudoviricetes sp.]